MRHLLTALLLSLTASLTACGPGEGEMLFVRHKGADMPVWVRGQAENQPLILVVHGGPGGTSFTLPESDGFQLLEAKYGVAYWEQRTSGSSQGNADESTLTPEQFREDLGLVVDLLKQQYPDRDLYLMGFSWGGLLTALYLQQPGMQSKVKGWIDWAGSVNVPLTVELSRTWVMQKAEEFVARGEDTKKWQERLDWYAKTPRLTVENFFTHAPWVDDAKGGVYSGRSAVTFGVIFDSPFDNFTMMSNGSKTQDRLFRQIFEINAVPALKSVTLPSLVICGLEDGKVPVGVCDEAFASLGTPEAKKTLVRVEKAAHAIQLDAPETFAHSVSTFIDANR